MFLIIPLFTNQKLSITMKVVKRNHFTMYFKKLFKIILKIGLINLEPLKECYQSITIWQLKKKRNKTHIDWSSWSWLTLQVEWVKKNLLKKKKIENQQKLPGSPKIRHWCRIRTVLSLLGLVSVVQSHTLSPSLGLLISRVWEIDNVGLISFAVSLGLVLYICLICISNKVRFGSDSCFFL